MIIRCIAHAKFLLILDNGYRIVTDPYDPSTGYPVSPLRADAVIVSHGHHDHSAVETVQGWTVVVREAGEHTLAPDVKVSCFKTFHDSTCGSQRGENLVSVVEAEGLRTAHLGDLGHLPDEALCGKLGRIDVMMIPVGGHFTIDAAQAAEVCRLLKPRVVIPMHYRGKAADGRIFGYDVISTAEMFRKACRNPVDYEGNELDVDGDTVRQTAFLSVL